MSRILFCNEWPADAMDYSCLLLTLKKYSTCQRLFYLLLYCKVLFCANVVFVGPFRTVHLIDARSEGIARDVDTMHEIGESYAFLYGSNAEYKVEESSSSSPHTEPHILRAASPSIWY